MEDVEEITHEDAPQEEESVAPDDEADDEEPPRKKRKHTHRLVFVGNVGACTADSSQSWELSTYASGKTMQISLDVSGPRRLKRIIRFDAADKGCFPTNPLDFLLSAENLEAMTGLEGVVDLRPGCNAIQDLIQIAEMRKAKEH